MILEIKNLSFIIDIDSYCNFDDLKNAKIYTDNSVSNDIMAIKDNIKHYKKIEIIEKENCQNLINGKNAFEYFLKGHLPFYGSHLALFDKTELPFQLMNKFIYVEDFTDIDLLEKIADKYDATIFSTKSFNRRSKKTFSYKSYLNLIQKIQLLKNSVLYIGYDYSDIAPLARIILGKDTFIYKSNQLSDEQLMFRYINQNNIDFFI
jgi:hypothetical protein